MNLSKKLLLIVCAVLLSISVVACQKTASNDVLESETDKTEQVITGDNQTADADVTEEKDDLVLDLIDLSQDKMKEESSFVSTGSTVVQGEVVPPADDSDFIEEVKYSNETMMIKFNHPFDGEINEELKSANVVKLEKLFDVGEAVWYTAYVKEGTDIHKSIETVQSLNSVLVAEYNYKYEATVEEGEEVILTRDELLAQNPKYTEQYVLSGYGIKEAWDYAEENGSTSGGSRDVVVAVIDTGVDYTHIDLAPNIWKNIDEIPDNEIDDDKNGYIDDYYGVNITTKDIYYGSSSEVERNGMDDHGHGTHVAGIIAAANNKEGVVGIAYNTKVMVIKAGDASGYFLNSNIAAAIIYAFENGADVINMSFGGTAQSTVVMDALAMAYNQCVLVASAGNSSNPNELHAYAVPNYPAAYPYVLGVMSVDKDNRESSFTNYDVKGYTNIEYEVYAPGEQILSTLPGDRYAVLSGTSMAAPVVSAQAAILRSVLKDRNTYPTKYIYGQISGAADFTAKCSDGNHLHLTELPGVVNFYSSFTESPRPEIGISDYTIFDSTGFELDTLNKNNGDGVIDAGETIALGLTLKNRWGMSENSIVHVEVANDLGVVNPYVTLLSNDVDYGAVGTYSEKDAGKIMDNGLWTGWEKPIYLKVSEGCPNNYTVRLEVHVTYENALDEEDTTVYESETFEILLKIRRGVILSGAISEDITLTKDNYYIIPSAVTILEGVTMTIEPGTRIQFWSTDEEDAYAEAGIAYISVKGTLLVNGTAEEPVEMYPSDWMDNYRVQISAATTNSFVSLNYANITNPYVYATEINNCTFNYNYVDNRLYYRELSGTNVTNRYSDGRVSADNTIYGSVFYKVVKTIIEANKVDTCMFVDSAISAGTNAVDEWTNNVFYGNTIEYEDQWGNKYTYVTSIDPTVTYNQLYVHDYFVVDGQAYMAINVKDASDYEYTLDSVILRRFLDVLGANHISFNSKKEVEEVFNNLKNYYYRTKITKSEDGTYFVNEDGSVVNGVQINLSLNNPGLKRNSSTFTFEEENLLSYNAPDLIEINYPFATRILLKDYVCSLHTGATYIIKAKITPSHLNYDALIFESEDESIATVDAEGKITANAAGSVKVNVYSSDRALRTSIVVNVTDSVALEGLNVEQDEIHLIVGNNDRINVDYFPFNTTEREVTFVSSDESIVSVDAYGHLTAKAQGEALITVNGAHDIKETVKIYVHKVVTGLNFTDDYYVTTMTFDDGTLFYPETAAPAELIEWQSSDNSVCYVDEDGKLVKVSKGTALLRASVKSTDYSDVLEVVVGDIEPELKIKKIFDMKGFVYFIMENGELWTVGGSNQYPYKCEVTYVDYYPFTGMNSPALYLLEDGSVYSQYYPETPMMTDVVKFSEKADYNSENEVYAIKKDGSVWSIYPQEEVIINNQPVKAEKVITTYYSSYILDQNGYLYFKGGTNTLSENWVLIDSNVIDIVGGQDDYYVSVLTYDEAYSLSDGRNSVSEKYGVIKKEQENDYIISYGAYSTTSSASFYLIRDGVLYRGSTGSSSSPVNLGVENVKSVHLKNYTTYIMTTDYKLYGYGSNNNFELGNGTTIQPENPIRMFFGIGAPESVMLEKVDVNLSVDKKLDQILSDEQLTVKFTDTFEKYLSADDITLKEVTRLEGFTPIKTVEDLRNMSKNLDGHYYLANDIEFTAEDYAEGNAWVPVGTEEAPFTGIFDGNGYAIKNLEVYGDESTLHAGLFGYADGIIRYAGLENVKVNSLPFAETAGSFAGVNLGITYGCYSTGEVSGYRFVGGLVGEGNVLYSINEADVTSQSESLDAAVTAVGGLTGNGQVEYCYNTGDVTGTIAGGLAGLSDVVCFSYNAGTVSTPEVELEGDIQKHISVGGLVGATAGLTIDSSWNVGAVTNRTTDSYAHVGGLAGSFTGTMTNCYNRGDVTSISGYAGGLMGVNVFTTYLGSENTENIVSDCYNTASVANTEGYAGGLVGYNANALQMTNCVQTVAVTLEEGEEAPAKHGWAFGINTMENLETSGLYSVETGLNAAGVDHAEISGTELTEEQMSLVESFESFDFETTWKMDGSYPKLSIDSTGVGLEKTETLTEEQIVSKDIEKDFIYGLKTFSADFVYGLKKGQWYQLHIPMAAFLSPSNSYNNQEILMFRYEGKDTSVDIEINEEILNDREPVSQETIVSSWNDFVKAGQNTRFYSNVILNRLNNDNVETWLRFKAPSSSSYYTLSLGGNYWGTDNENLINKQIIDFDDFQNLMDINEGEYLTKAPEDTYPFVVDAYLEIAGEKVETVGNQLVTFVVEFNRDMDTSIDLDVKFGSYYPYADYKVEGEYVNPRQWAGTMQMTTIIENGYQYWSVSNGQAKDTSFKLMTDWGRFPFMIDTSMAQALIMQAEATDSGINLTWTQDDFDTLAGYNVYRSTSENGVYTRLNRSIISWDTKEFFDDAIEPGVTYYYNFTVVKTDLTESEPSGKISITAKDTLSPDIYHSRIYHAFTGNHLMISATITDNLGVDTATVYYRIKGTSDYQAAVMIKNNDKYTGLIPAEFITVEGLEYYIEANDGVTSTFEGTAEEPIEVTVQTAVSASDMGDVNGDGQITLQDAMKALYAKYGRYNLTADEFARADLDGDKELSTKEVLTILQYVNGTITSIPIGG